MYRAGGSTTHKEHATHYTRHTLHNPPETLLFILYLLVKMANTETQTAEKFDRFIKRVEGLQSHFANHNRKACQLFNFEYAFNKQLETNAPLFTLYFSYN